MPVTVRGGDILFNDGSTQSTAAGAPTTAQVLSATAGASAGAVGTYAFLSRPAYSVSPLVPGTNYAGSGFRYAGAWTQGALQNTISSTSVSGTWKAMGYTSSFVGQYDAGESGTVMLRIS